MYTLLTILIMLWLVGLVAHVGGGFIHVLLLVAGVLFLMELLGGRRGTV